MASRAKDTAGILLTPSCKRAQSSQTGTARSRKTALGSEPAAARSSSNDMAMKTPRSLPRRFTNDVANLSKIPAHVARLVTTHVFAESEPEYENFAGCVTVELMPSWDLVIEEPYRVDFFITPNYPLDAPKIHIPNKEPLLPNKDLVWDRSGFLIIPLVSTDSKGWSRGYDLRVVIYGVRRLLEHPDHKLWELPGTVPLSFVEMAKSATSFYVQAQFDVFLGESQGRRPTMEDAHFFVPAFSKSVVDSGILGADACMFGVLDGHGGSGCAEYVSDRLPYAVNEHLLTSSSIEEALFKAFIDTDNEFLSTQSDTSGATACVVLYDGRHTLYTANTGDCRAIVCRNRKAVELSRDMKASSAEEIARIAAMGGFVTIGRVNATLAVARAFGDAALKMPPNPVLLCDPEITKCVLQPEDQFVLIACDGLYDVMTSDEAAGFVFDHLVNDEPEIVVQKLVNHAVGELKSFDNVSALLAMINPLRTIHETQLPEDHRINLIPTVDPSMSIDDLLPPSPKAPQGRKANGDGTENENGGEEEDEEPIITRARS